jgi:hypothetical protein
MLLRLSFLLVMWLFKLLRMLVVLLWLLVALLSSVVVMILLTVLGGVHYLGHTCLRCLLHATPTSHPLLGGFVTCVCLRALEVIVSLPSLCLFGLSSISKQHKTMKKSINNSLRHILYGYFVLFQSLNYYIALKLIRINIHSPISKYLIINYKKNLTILSTLKN